MPCNAALGCVLSRVLIVKWTCATSVRESPADSVSTGKRHDVFISETHLFGENVPQVLRWVGGARTKLAIWTWFCIGQPCISCKPFARTRTLIRTSDTLASITHVNHWPTHVLNCTRRSHLDQIRPTNVWVFFLELLKILDCFWEACVRSHAQLWAVDDSSVGATSLWE